MLLWVSVHQENTALLSWETHDTHHAGGPDHYTEQAAIMFDMMTSAMRLLTPIHIYLMVTHSHSPYIAHHNWTH